MKIMHFLYFLCICLFIGCSNKKLNNTNENLERAELTLDSLYSHYGVENSNLLRETYPFDKEYTATYLASEEQTDIPNQYSYLWPYSGTFSAANALWYASGNNKYKELLDSKILPGLEEYFDTTRYPAGYASYINSAPVSDRFYDDNVWLGIDFTDLYNLTKDDKYLDKAKLIWTFVASGMDDKLGGGIYWCEQKKESKNTCSNAPGAVLALKLYNATNDSTYLQTGKELYQWTKEHLQDSTDYLYFDNIGLNGNIGKAKYPYNSGQMMQVAALLYKATGDKNYLLDAQNIANAAYNYFFSDFNNPEGENFRLLKRNDIWFIAVMLRGFIELYYIDMDRKYIDVYNKNLSYAWAHARENNGLFNIEWDGSEKDEKKWLLTQAAFVEMYARIAEIEKLNN